MQSHDFETDIIDPNNPAGPRVQATIPHRLILNYYKFYPVRYENFRAVRHVLAHTERIFTGIRRFNEGGWCFTGKPRLWYIREGVEVPFDDTLVFTVYINPRLVVHEARAEKADQDDGMCPDDWQNRYGGLIWKNTS